MRKVFVLVAVAAIAVPVLGGIGYATVQAVSSTPAPEVILPPLPERDVSSATSSAQLPSSTQDSSSSGSERSSDSSASHDLGDDRGGLAPASSFSSPFSTESSSASTESSSLSTASSPDDHGGRRKG